MANAKDWFMLVSVKDGVWDWRRLCDSWTLCKPDCLSQKLLHGIAKNQMHTTEERMLLGTTCWSKSSVAQVLGVVMNLSAKNFQSEMHCCSGFHESIARSTRRSKKWAFLSIQALASSLFETQMFSENLNSDWHLPIQGRLNWTSVVRAFPLLIIGLGLHFTLFWVECWTGCQWDMSWACVHGNVSSVKVCILEANQSHCGTRHFNAFAWPRKLNKNASDGLIACWTDTKILMHMLFSLLVICHVIMRATMVFSSSVQEKLLYKYSHCSCTVWPFWLRNGNWWSGWSIKLSCLHEPQWRKTKPDTNLDGIRKQKFRR